MKSNFKTPTGKVAILALYDKKLAELNIDYEYQSLDTSFGQTNIIVSGNPKNPPIILIHGSNGCAPIAYETYPNLSQSFRVYAVDVLAQPNKSAETRLSMKDDSYGQWMNEIIDILGLQSVTLAGFSFGGLVILKTLINNDNKIKEVFLSAPAYVVNGNPLKALFKFFIPMRRYMKTQRKKYLEQFLNAAFTAKDEFALKFLGQVFIHFEMDFTPVPVISKAEAGKITTPISLIAAKNDIIFPGVKMIKRASKIFPSLKQTTLLEHSKHVQNASDNRLIENLILDSIS